MINRRQCVHLLLLALIILILTLYGVLRTHFVEMANFAFNAYPLMALDSIFPPIFGIALFTRYFVSIKCNYKRPYLVWVCMLIVMTILVVLADRYFWLEKAFYYSIIVWAETLCEFLTLRKNASNR